MVDVFYRYEENFGQKILNNLKNQFAIAYKPKLRYQGQKVSQDQEPTPT